MIKLQRKTKPAYLTDEKVALLTSEFRNSKKAVWNVSHIKIPLLSSSNGKCAYCECSLTKESSYMEVEHFEDKKFNPKKVILWDNLLPACKKCNGAKSTHDVIADPIINPYDEEPKDHLSLRLYRLRGKTTKGRTTIAVTNLNNSARLVSARFEIGEKIDDLVELSWERFISYLDNKCVRTTNKLIALVEGLLRESQTTSAYSATTATNLLTDIEFQKLVAHMMNEKIWTEELDQLMIQSAHIVLDCA